MDSEQAAVEQASEPTVIVRMLKQRGNLNVTDIAGFPASLADKLVADGVAVVQIVGVDVDADGRPLRDAIEQVSTDEVTDNNKPWSFDPKTDPFMTDGISKQASQALHAQNLHTVEAVRNFLASLPEGADPVAAVNEIEGVTDAQAERIVKAYGITTEHSS